MCDTSEKFPDPRLHIAKKSQNDMIKIAPTGMISNQSMVQKDPDDVLIFFGVLKLNTAIRFEMKSEFQPSSWHLNHFQYICIGISVSNYRVNSPPEINFSLQYS